MVTLKADETILAWLGQAREKAEVRGPAGQLLGYFEPRVESEAEKYERARRLFDPVEIERRMGEEKDQGLTYEQVKEHLRQLESGR